jgi:hypothetical protein
VRECGANISAKAANQNPNLENFHAGCAAAWSWPARCFYYAGDYKVLAISEFRVPALQPHTDKRRSARPFCFALLYSSSMRKSNQHRINEKIRKDARLQKLVKKAKKRAVQGGTPAAEV